MTGLYNRGAAERIIKETLKADPDTVGALLLFDVDNLKSLNDTKGHLKGDGVLTTVAQVLVRHFRSTDIVGRAGGDEFIAFLPGMSDEQTLAPSLQKLHKKIAAIGIEGVEKGEVHLSIGCTFCSGAESFRASYNRADSALYSVKRSCKNGFAFFREGMKIQQE